MSIQPYFEPHILAHHVRQQCESRTAPNGYEYELLLLPHTYPSGIPSRKFYAIAYTTGDYEFIAEDMRAKTDREHKRYMDKRIADLT